MDHFSYWCIYIHSIPEVPNNSHQENSHIKEFMMTIAERPEMGKKKLRTKVEMEQSHKLI